MLVTRTPRARLHEIDRVDADSVAGDDFELREFVDQRRRCAEFPAHGDGSRLRRRRTEKRVLVAGQPKLADVIVSLHRLRISRL